MTPKFRRWACPGLALLLLGSSAAVAPFAYGQGVAQIETAPVEPGGTGSILDVAPPAATVGETEAEAVVPVADPFVWSATKAGDGTITLSGFAPAVPFQRVSAIRAGEGTTDLTTIATGAPDGFIIEALAGLDALALLDDGTITFDGTQWRIAGAATTENFATLALSSDTWTIEIATPDMAAREAGDEPEPVAAGSDAGADGIGDAIAAEASTDADAPVAQDPAIAAAAPTEVEALSDMDTEAVATAQSPAETPAGDDATGAAEPQGEDVDDAEPAEAADETVALTPMAQDGSAEAYAFSAIKGDDGAVALTGTLPAASAVSYFAALGDADVSGIEIVAGAPEAFLPAAQAGVRTLVLLASGALDYDGAAWTLSGVARSAEDAAAIAAEYAARPDAALWTVAIEEPDGEALCASVLAEFSSRNAVLFGSGSTVIAEVSAAALQELAADVAICPQLPVYIAGHTDADGEAAANLALSVRRAEAVIAALIELGVTPDRLYAVGFGESVPIADNATAEGKRLNRRIVVSVEEPE